MDLTKPKGENTEREQMLYRTAQGLAFVSAVFSLVVAALLALSWLKVRDAQPADSKVMTLLIERVKQEKNNKELIEETRTYDMLARRAHFNYVEFMTRGAWLLLGGVMVLVVSLKFMSGVKLDLPKPGEKKEGEGNTMARWVVSCFGLMLVIIAGILIVGPVGSNAMAEGAKDKPDDPVPVANGQTVAQTPGKPKKPAKPDKPANQIPAEAFKKNWPAFRGYMGHGVSETAKPPTEWDGEGEKNILWKVKPDMHGYNSPVVWDKKVFITGSNGRREKVYCYNADTGEIIWEKEAKDVPGAPQEPPEVTPDTGYAAATVACDGNQVYAVFATGNLVCFDMDGNQVWARNLGLPDINYGYASSLIEYQGVLYIQKDEAMKASVMAINTADGKEIWKTKREGVDMCWCTPAVIPQEGADPILVLNGNPEVRAYEIKSGKKLWAWDGMGGEVATSPTFADGTIVVAQEYGTSAGLSLKGKELWINDDADLPDVASPVAHKGKAFIPNAGGSFACIDIKSGEIKWDHYFDDGFYASPIVADGKIYAMERGGVMQIMDATADEFKLLASPNLGEGSSATPAFVGKRIYIRGDRNLYCIGEKD